MHVTLSPVSGTWCLLVNVSAAATLCHVMGKGFQTLERNACQVCFVLFCVLNCIVILFFAAVASLLDLADHQRSEDHRLATAARGRVDLFFSERLLPI